MESYYQQYIHGTKAILPYGIVINNFAFEDCKCLTSIEIPNSVTKIGTDAFRGCTGLTSIDIPKSVTHIGCDSFRGCICLKRISIMFDDPNSAPITRRSFEPLIPSILNNQDDIDLSQITLFVPIGTGYAYRHHPFFSKFKEVKAILK